MATTLRTQLSRGTCASAPLRWLSLERRRSTRARCTRAPCRAGYGRSGLHERALHWREASLRRRQTVVRRASCGLQSAASFRVASASVPLRWLSPRRRRGTRSCCARTPCRAGCERFGRRDRALYRRNASLLRRPAMVRDVPAAASYCAARARAPLHCLSLGRRRSTRACRARAPCRAGCDRPRAMKGTVPVEGLFPSMQDRGATCQLWPPTHSQLSRGTCPRATALPVSPEAAQHASLMRARAVPRWLRSVHTT